ncbi:MAG: head-tail adaptor protein, partial [bacterium]|nr:head-tail adaptor protein [bacterium]
MRSGLMRDYVEIQKNTPTRGDSGEEIDAWTSRAFTWAYIRANDGEESITSYTIRIRFQTVDHTDRILFGSTVYDIVSVLDKDGAKRDLQIEAK